MEIHTLSFDSPLCLAGCFPPGVPAPAQSCRSAEPPPDNCEPVNPNAMPEARALLKNLCAISGKYILSGQHNFPSRLSQHSEKLDKSAGKYPAIWGSDFGFTGGDDQDSIAHRRAVIDEAKKQAAQGSITGTCCGLPRTARHTPRELERQRPGPAYRRATPDMPLHRRWESTWIPPPDI